MIAALTDAQMVGLDWNAIRVKMICEKKTTGEMLRKKGGVTTALFRLMIDELAKASELFLTCDERVSDSHGSQFLSSDAGMNPSR
jgi:hypothetical protein